MSLAALHTNGSRILAKIRKVFPIWLASVTVFTQFAGTVHAAPDIVPEISAPSQGAVVSGTVTVNATTTDVSVLGMTLLVDGVPVGAEDTVAPYSFAWDTIPVSNGTH